MHKTCDIPCAVSPADDATSKA